MQDFMTFLSNHLALTYSLASVLVLLMIIEFLRQKSNNYRVNTSQAIQLINREQAVVVDIRSPELFSKGHIIDSVSLSSREIQDTPKKIERFKTKPIILVCSTGSEAQKITQSLLKQGYNVYLLSGGIRAWTEAALPLVKE